MAILDDRDREVYDNPTPSPTRAAASGLSFVAWIVYIIATIIVGLLIIRFVLLLLGANPLNGFANFIYSVTKPLIAPFNGLFSYGDIVAGQSRFEVTTLVAIVVYSLIAFILVKVLSPRRVV